MTLLDAATSEKASGDLHDLLALTVDETIGGKTVEAHAPRLSVFRRSEGAWLVMAHANFAHVKQ